MHDLRKIEAIARRAGAAITAVYEAAEGIAVQYKDDDSPLTEADRRANALIVDALAGLEPKLPVLSEESVQPGHNERRQWESYWLVDPLDGTREFIKRNGEFTVNIALVSNGVAELGVVHVPVGGVSYLGDIARGAFRQETGAAPESIRARKIGDLKIRRGIAKAAQDTAAPGGGSRAGAASRDGVSGAGATAIKMVASRSHLDPHVQRMAQELEAVFGAVELVNMGSSLKICLLAEGEADIYPRLAPTCEWDTAAAHAVLAAAGGEVYDTRFSPLRYNRKEDLRNPHFIAVGDTGQDWRALLIPKAEQEH